MQASIRRIALDAAGYRSIELDAPEFEFHSGQYLSIRCKAESGTDAGVDDDVGAGTNELYVPLSIASAAARLPNLRLIYRSDAASAEAIALDQLLSTATEISIGAATGSIRVPNAGRFSRLHLIASGTGIAGALGVADHVLSTNSTTSVQLTWTSPQTPSWLAHLLGEYGAERLNLERTNSAELAARQWHADTSTWHLLCGAPDFVYPVFDCMCAAGITPEQVASDVFDYAPRD